MAAIGLMPAPKGGRLLTGVRLREGAKTVNAGQLNGVRKHERTANGGWKQIDWKKAEETVNRIQIRIVKAVKSGKSGLVKRLQYLLAHSFYAKALAVKRVTSSHGKRTPGVDGVVWKTQKDKYEAIFKLNDVGYHPKALRRIYIEKPGKTEKRPLSIPSMIDRAMQALYLLTLAPIAETLADKTSFGFRECRSTADAMQYAHLMLSRKTAPQWIVEGDIKKLLRHHQSSVADRQHPDGYRNPDQIPQSGLLLQKLSISYHPRVCTRGSHFSNSCKHDTGRLATGARSKAERQETSLCSLR